MSLQCRARCHCRCLAHEVTQDESPCLVRAGILMRGIDQQKKCVEPTINRVESLWGGGRPSSVLCMGVQRTFFRGGYQTNVGAA